jgi:hypothetical protein
MITREVLSKEAKKFKCRKYSEDFYSYHLGILQKEKEVNNLLKTAVESLFLWKLGKVRSKQTKKSCKLEFIDSKGNQYYAINTTDKHKKAIEKALQGEMLKKAIDFRNGKIDYNEFKDCAFRITTYVSSIVLPAFYIHMWRPAEYPILDDKVWKVYCKESNRAVKKNTKPRSWAHYEEYTIFFNKLVHDTGIDSRTVDKGLWVLGHEHKNIGKKVQLC